MLLASGLVMAPSAARAADTCGRSGDGELCLTVPDEGVPLSGEQTISASWSGTGWAAMEFTLDGSYLHREFVPPYSFTWPTNKELDGTHTLAARVYLGEDSYGAYISTTVKLKNGNITTIPRSPADYESLFAPRSGRTIAAVGNAGSEKPAEKRLESYIESTEPAAFFYLGEVHEYGTWASRRDHYGLASFDDPRGVGTLWGRMAGYTLATPGNHERLYLTEFQDYWHQRPLWSTTVINGVRIYALTSECGDNACGPNSAQATWLREQLAVNTEQCVLSFWHRPVVSVDKDRSGSKMNEIWAMLADSGGDLVLNADTRDMEEVRAMNAALETNKPDSHQVELISGAGAARWVAAVSDEPRVAWRAYEIPGALFIDTGANRLSWEFRDSSGVVLRTGSVHC
jgi:hypothetical protein